MLCIGHLLLRDTKKNPLDMKYHSSLQILSTQYKLQRDDSTDELLKSVHAQREARKKQLLASANKYHSYIT